MHPMEVVDGIVFMFAELLMQVAARALTVRFLNVRSDPCGTFPASQPTPTTNDYFSHECTRECLAYSGHRTRHCCGCL